jgi:integrase/recombinase XerD
MGDVDDFQKFSQTFSNERASLQQHVDEGQITADDADAIDRFLKAKDDIKVSTLAEYLKRIRLTAKRADTPLLEMDHRDLRDLFFAFTHGEHPDVKDDGLSENTLRNYRKALRVFFSFHGREWADDIEVGAPVKSRISQDDILEPPEIKALRDAACRPRNTALVEFLADTGARLSMVGSLRVRDVDLDGERATYTPNPEAAGLKGAPQQPYPIIDSRATLRTYLRDAHPRPDRPDVALFHKLQGYEPDGDGAITPQHLNRTLKDLAETAGIDKPVNPHSFRHAAISRMYREGYTKQQIQHRVAWTLDTDMWERYVHLTAEDMNEQIYAAAGVTDEEEAARQTRDRCGNCREVVPEYADYCPNCGDPTTADARQLLSDAEDDTVEDIVAAADPEERKLLQQVRAIIRDNPEFLTAEVGGD